MIINKQEAATPFGVDLRPQQRVATSEGVAASNGLRRPSGSGMRCYPIDYMLRSQAALDLPARHLIGPCKSEEYRNDGDPSGMLLALKMATGSYSAALVGSTKPITK